jgi:HPt (histidine-containing phosphotransfer) domain-containing protein
LNRTDLEYLISMTGNDKEVTFEMIDIFIEQVGEFGQEMLELLECRKYKELGQLAHKAKSSVAIMGMHKLANQLKELEILAIGEKNPEEYISYVENFNMECKEAVNELNIFKKNFQK